MSDDRSSDGLPTAAILDLTRLPRTEDGEFTGFYESSSVLIPEIERVEDEDELVRREDVEALIQDKIDRSKEELEETEDEDLKHWWGGQVRALEELLDEVHEAV